jgi:F0F1-type ATP synthase delta subunit
MIWCKPRGGVQSALIEPIFLAKFASQPGVSGAMFLTFAINEERAEFLRQVAAERADLLTKLHSAVYQPTIVCRGLTDEEAEWLKQRASQRAKVHPDIKFSPLR